MQSEIELGTTKPTLSRFQDIFVGFLAALILVLIAFVICDQLFSDERELEQIKVGIPTDDSEQADVAQRTQTAPLLKATKIDTSIVDTSISKKEMDELIEQYKDEPGFYESSTFDQGANLHFLVIPRLDQVWESEGPGDSGKSYISDVYLYVGIGYVKIYSYTGSEEVTRAHYSHVTLLTNTFALFNEGSEAGKKTDVAFILSNSFNCCGGGGGSHLINRLFLYSSKDNAVTVYTFNQSGPSLHRVSDYLDFFRE